MNIPIGATDINVIVRALTQYGVPIENRLAADFTLFCRRDGANIPITLHDLPSLDAPHAAGGLHHSTGGWYRIDIPDSLLVSGVYKLEIVGSITGGVLITAPISLTPRGILGSGYIPVNHDYPTANNMTVEDSSGSPQENVRIRYYFKADFDAGNRGPEYVRGESVTLANGTWGNFIYCFPGEATFTFTKPSYQFKSRDLMIT